MDSILDEALDGSQVKGDDSTTSDDVHIHQDDDMGTITVQGGAVSLADPNQIQYQIRADGGQGGVTYRVVQVAANGDQQGQVVTTGFPAGGQAVIQTAFNGGSPTSDGQADTRFTYFPSVSGADGGASQQDAAVALSAGQSGIASGNWQADANLPQGQFYVMMSPQDVLQGQRNIAPRAGYQPKIDGGRSVRDDRRRATHNEVERRRRDKINNWIVQLSKLVPDCSTEHTKQGQLGSKGGILSKACDYITDLRNSNTRMNDALKETERLSVDNELLQQQVEDLKNENMVLRSTLQQHGIGLPDVTGSNS